MKAWFDVQFWTAHPFSSFSLHSSEAGFMLKASYILLCLCRPYSPSCLYKLTVTVLMTDTQPHDFPLCTCHFMFPPGACKAWPALWLCDSWTGAESGQTHSTCENCLWSCDKSSLTPVSGDRLLLPVYSTALIWAS